MAPLELSGELWPTTLWLWAEQRLLSQWRAWMALVSPTGMPNGNLTATLQGTQ